MASYNKNLDLNGQQAQLNTKSSKVGLEPELNDDKENLTTRGKKRTHEAWTPKPHGVFGGGDASVQSNPREDVSDVSPQVKATGYLFLEQKDMNTNGADNDDGNALASGDNKLEACLQVDKDKTENQNSNCGDTSYAPSDGQFHSLLSTSLNSNGNISPDPDVTPKLKDISNEDTGTYESASENEPDESEIEVVSDNDNQNSPDDTTTPIKPKDETQNVDLNEAGNSSNLVGQNLADGNCSSPPALNWDEFNFVSQEQDSSMSVNYNSFMATTPTPKKLPRLSLRQQSSDSDTTTESPLSSSRSAPPDLSKDYTQDGSRESDVFLSDTTNVAEESGENQNSPTALRNYLSAPLHASTPTIPKNRQNEKHSDLLIAELAVGEKSDSVKNVSSISTDVETSTSSSVRSCSVGSTGTKKRNSVTFDPNTVDIDEVMSSRQPKASKNVGVVSPSILVNSSNGNMQENIFFTSNGNGVNSNSDDDYDDALTAESSSVLVDELKMAELGIEGHISTLTPKEQSEFPISVTEFRAENGVKVCIVGTARFSEQSQKDVVQTIRKVEPRMVMLELSENRLGVLSLDDSTLEELEGLTFGHAKETLKESGILKGLFQLAFATTNSQLTQQLEEAAGGELRSAAYEATKILGCKIILGDLPYSVTFGRLIATIGFFQKIRLTRWLLKSTEDFSLERFESFRNKDFMGRMLCDMTEIYPATRVFIEEREKYLSYSLKQAAITAKNGAIVGVVNMDNVPGILKYWGTVTEDEIEEISRIPEPSHKRTIIRGTLKITCYLLIGYGVFKLSKSIWSSKLVSSNVSKLIPTGLFQMTPASS